MDCRDSLTRQLGCSERTAEGILRTFRDAKLGDCMSVEVLERERYLLLEIKTAAGEIYYARGGLDNLITSIRERSPDGKVIFRRMR